MAVKPEQQQKNIEQAYKNQSRNIIHFRDFNAWIPETDIDGVDASDDMLAIAENVNLGNGYIENMEAFNLSDLNANLKQVFIDNGYIYEDYALIKYKRFFNKVYVDMFIFYSYQYRKYLFLMIDDFNTFITQGLNSSVNLQDVDLGDFNTVIIENIPRLNLNVREYPESTLPLFQDILNLILIRPNGQHYGVNFNQWHALKRMLSPAISRKEDSNNWDYEVNDFTNNDQRINQFNITGLSTSIIHNQYDGINRRYAFTYDKDSITTNTIANAQFNFNDGRIRKLNSSTNSFTYNYSPFFTFLSKDKSNYNVSGVYELSLYNFINKFDIIYAKDFNDAVSGSIEVRVYNGQNVIYSFKDTGTGDSLSKEYKISVDLVSIFKNANLHGTSNYRIYIAFNLTCSSSVNYEAGFTFITLVFPEPVLQILAITQDNQYFKYTKDKLYIPVIQPLSFSVNPNKLNPRISTFYLANYDSDIDDYLIFSGIYSAATNNSWRNDSGNNRIKYAGTTYADLFGEYVKNVYNLGLDTQGKFNSVIYSECVYKNINYVAGIYNKICYNHEANTVFPQYDVFAYNEDNQYGFFIVTQASRCFKLFRSKQEELIICTDNGIFVYKVSVDWNSIKTILKLGDSRLQIEQPNQAIETTSESGIVFVFNSSGIYVYQSGSQAPVNITHKYLKNYWQRKFYNINNKMFYNQLRNELWITNPDKNFGLIYEIDHDTFKTFSFNNLQLLQIEPNIKDGYLNCLFSDNNIYTIYKPVNGTLQRTNKFKISIHTNSLGRFDLWKILQVLYISYTNDYQNKDLLRITITTDMNDSYVIPRFLTKSTIQNTILPLLMRCKKVSITIEGSDRLTTEVVRILEFGLEYNIEVTRVPAEQSFGSIQLPTGSGYGEDYGNNYGN